jgi:hypothetical protein
MGGGQVTDQSVEELLAALADGEEQQAPPAETAKDTNAMKQVREALKRAKAAEAELRAERDELAAKFQARVEADTTAALQSAGLSPRQAEAYRKLYDEVTPENVGAFKTEVLGQTDEEPASLIPLNLTVEKSAKRYSRAEFERVMREDPNQGLAIANAGLVDFERR